MVGQTLSHYRILEKLGSGGMGEVYRGLDTKLDREVALKVLPPELVADPERKRRFIQEAKAAAKLEHPHIGVVHEIDEADGVTFIAMELIRGEKLQDLLQQERLTLTRSLELATEAAEGLSCAHERGIVHRDLKPANIMVTEQGHAKIIDFGLAKLVEPLRGEGSEVETAVRAETEPGKVMGTVSYMSPEQARGQTVDHRSDVFSFGIVFYQMLTGELPFQGSTAADTLSAILKNPSPRLPELGSGITTEAAHDLQRTVDKCLAKEPDLRYQTMKDVVLDLRSAWRSLESGAKTAAARRLGLGRWLLAAASGLAILLLGWLLLWPRGGTTITTDPKPSIAVMYFENLADSTDSDNLGRMLTSLLITELSRSEEWEVVSSQRLFDITRRLRRDEGPLDRSVATEVAKQAGASTMMLGQIGRAGQRMVVTTELVEVSSGRLLGSPKAEGESKEDIFAMAEALGEQVRGELGPPLQADGKKDLASQLTGSVDAYRAYVRGETLFQRRDFAEAAEQFREAIRIDPNFALAHYRLSVLAEGMLGRSGEARESANRAVELRERLPAQYRDIVEGNAFYIDGDYSKGIPFLESVLERDPENVEALMLLSEMYIHSARDNDVSRAAILMENILALDPDYHWAYHHLAVAYVLQGKPEKVRDRLNLWEVNEPVSVQDIRAELAILEGRPEEALRLTEGHTGLIGQAVRPLAAILAPRWNLARELTSLDPSYLGEGFLQAATLLLRGTVHAYWGEFEQAVSALRQGGAVTGYRKHEGYGGLPILGLRGLSDLFNLKGDLEAARAEIERALPIQPNSPRSLYYAGLASLRIGDRSAVARYVQTLEDELTVARSPSAYLYRDALEAEIALAQGRPEEARTIFERILSSGKVSWDYYAYQSSPATAFRDGLIRTYFALEEKDKAAETLEDILSSGYERLGYPVHYVRSLYTLGKLKIEAGETAEGRELLRQFLEFWGEADWDLPEVRDARALLAS